MLWMAGFGRYTALLVAAVLGFIVPLATIFPGKAAPMLLRAKPRGNKSRPSSS